MGGLFSSDNKSRHSFTSHEAAPQRHYGGSYIYAREETRARAPLQRPPSQRPSTISSQTNQAYARSDHEIQRLYRQFESLQIHRAQPERCIQGPQRSVLNSTLFNMCPSLYNVVTYIELQPYDSEYQKITKMITRKKNFKVDSIEKIVNPYLEKAYELKKSQKQSQYPYIEEQLLFHGTKRANVDTICRMNFNWRLCQAHKFGRGISFSPNSTYASNYSDQNVYNKVMIVAKVLIGRICIGNQFMQLPLSGCDTSQKEGGVVIVKFEDNEFYPAYKINYHVIDENVGKGNKYRKQNSMRGRPRHIVSPVYFDEDYYYDYD